MAKPRESEEEAIIKTKHKGSSNFSRTILCAACELGKQTRRSPDSESTTNYKGMNIRRNYLDPGDEVSIDQYISSIPGRLSTSFGKEKEMDKFNGGTIFCDHASSAIQIVNQVSLKSGETVKSKHLFEKFCREHNILKIKKYRADNLPFRSQRFMDDINQQNQLIDFSGVGAHHQNGVAERAIQTVTRWGRTMLLDMILHWPDQANLHSWPFALEHAVFV